MKKYYEEELPEGYEEVFSIDAKEDKKVVRQLTIGSLLLLVIIAVPLGLLIDFERITLTEFMDGDYFLLITLLFAYIIMHELTHGIVYKILTKHKLTFGLTLTVAFCGVPDIYTYWITAMSSLAAPFVSYTIILIPCMVVSYFQDMGLYIVFAIIFAMHISGCVGDLYDMYLLLTKYNDKRLLMRDTGPKQTFYLPK